MRIQQEVAANEPIILVREGEGWRHYLVISDGRVVIHYMSPALFGGWRFDERPATVQGEAEWPGMSRDSIVAWKLGNDDSAHVAAVSTEFRARLLSRGAEVSRG